MHDFDEGHEHDVERLVRIVKGTLRKLSSLHLSLQFDILLIHIPEDGIHLYGFLNKSFVVRSVGINIGNYGMHGIYVPHEPAVSPVSPSLLGFD